MNQPDHRMQKIIVSRTDNIGDVMLSLPAIGRIKAEYPSASVIFLGKRYTQPIAEACVHIDTFWDKDQLANYDASSADAIVFLFPNRSVAHWAWAQHIPIRIGTSHRWWHWLYCNRRVDFSRKRSDLHESQLNFKLLAPLGIGTDVTLAEIPALYGLRGWQAPLPAFLEKRLGQPSYKLVLHPKSKGSAREWGMENYYRLAQSVPDHTQVFLTGTASEGASVGKECPDIFTLPNVTSLMGELSLPQLISFLSRVDALVACSTGPLHIAAALGKHAVGIYPNIRPMHPGRWQPVGDHAETVVFDRPGCTACAATPDHCACMQQVGVAQVRQRLKAIPPTAADASVTGLLGK